jgi:hypothetical protein
MLGHLNLKATGLKVLFSYEYTSFNYADDTEARLLGSSAKLWDY